MLKSFPKMNNKKTPAFTLIELIIAIVLLGIALPPIATVILEGTRQNAGITVRMEATLLAASLTEEIRSRRFDQNVSPPWSATLGPELGETRTTYNDVDDYNGLSESISGFSGYTRSVGVSYVLAGSLNTPFLTQTNYKRIAVTCTGPAGVAVTLVSLMVGKQ